MASGLLVRELFTAFGLDIDAASFVKAELLVGGIQKAVAIVADVAARAFTEFTKLVLATAEQASHLEDLSAQTGISTDLLQQWGYAAGFVGVSLDGVAQSMAFLAKRGVKDLSKGLLDVGDALKKLPPGGARVDYVLEHLGTRSRDLIPLLIKSREELTELFAEAPMMSPEAIKAGADFDSSMRRIHGTLQEVGYTVAGPLIDAIGPLLKEFLAWTRENKKLIQQKLTTVFKAIGAVLVFLVRVAVQLVKTFGLLYDGIVAVADVLFGPLITAAKLAWDALHKLSAGAILAAGAVAVAWAVAAIPFVGIALLIGILILLFHDLYWFFKGGRETAIGHFIEQMKSIAKVVKEDLVRAFETGLANIKKLFLDTLVWLGAQYQAFIQKLISFVPGGAKGIGIIASAAAGTMGMNLDPDVAAKLMGGGSSPAATAAAKAGAGAVVNAPVVTTFNVTAAPGMDIQALVQEFDLKMRELLEAQHQATISAVGGQ